MSRKMKRKGQLKALVSADELLTSEVWLVRASSNVDFKQLLESFLQSLTVAAGKKETVTIVGADRTRAMALTVKGVINVNEEVDTDGVEPFHARTAVMSMK